MNNEPLGSLPTGRDVAAAWVVCAVIAVVAFTPAVAQTGGSGVASPYAAALPPPAESPAPITDPNAPRCMLLEGYGGDGHLYEHWQLVRPQDFDVTNYHGFHTSGEGQRWPDAVVR